MIYAVLLYILMLLFPIIASIRLNGTYSRCKKITTSNETTGYDAAKEILDRNGLSNIYIVETRGSLTDHYDPTRKILRLSSEVYHGTSVAAVSVAAHEAGHALQDYDNYKWFRIRSSIYPTINIGTKIAYALMIVGLFLEMFNFIYAAIAMTTLSLIFEIVTLPCEKDASNRAKEKLVEYKIVDNEEKKDVDKMLDAAAFTYIAAIISSLLRLLYYLTAGSRRN